MNIFRLFFVTTVLIPVVVIVVATSGDDGRLEIKRHRNLVIAEDGTAAGRRYNPVNISDRNCPSLGCSGNLTSKSYNGKGFGASESSSNEFSTGEARSVTFYHQHPFKLEIKSIKNSTKSNSADSHTYFSEQEVTGRSFISTAVVISWAVFLAFRAIISLVVYNVFTYFWSSMRKRSGIGDDYIEYYVKLGQDAKHPFHNYGGSNPTFGISLKSKNELKQPAWKGWAHPYHGQHYQQSASYNYPQSQWPSPYYGAAHGWKTSSEEEHENLRHKFDKSKGWKYAKKHTKKYGKKAHKYGLRPSKYSHLFDHQGNIILDSKKGQKHRYK